MTKVLSIILLLVIGLKYSAIYSAICSDRYEFMQFSDAHESREEQSDKPKTDTEDNTVQHMTTKSFPAFYTKRPWLPLHQEFDLSFFRNVTTPPPDIS